jgi:protein involved in ribonucleotide reduction
MMAIGSKILIYSSDTANSERFVRLLMYQRFITKRVESLSYASLALASGEYPIFLCTYSPEETETLDFLKTTRQDTQLRSVVPVIMLKNPTRDILAELIKSGCSNFILQDAGQQALIDKMEEVALSLGDVREKRQFVRIEIPEYENSQLLITAKNGNKYPIRISNISMGGLQLEWSAEKMPVQRMVVGEVLVNCLLIMKSLDLYVDLRIISIFNYKAGLQFIGMNEERLSKLCSFLYERLLSEKV